MTLQVESSLVLVPRELWWAGGVYLGLGVSLLLQAGMLGGSQHSQLVFKGARKPESQEGCCTWSQIPSQQLLGVENVPSQRLDPEHNAPTLMYCLTQVEKTFAVQIQTPPVFLGFLPFFFFLLS